MRSNESGDIASGVSQILEEMDEGEALIVIDLPKMKMDVLQTLHYKLEKFS